MVAAMPYDEGINSQLTGNLQGKSQLLVFELCSVTKIAKKGNDLCPNSLRTGTGNFPIKNSESFPAEQGAIWPVTGINSPREWFERIARSLRPAAATGANRRGDKRPSARSSDNQWASTGEGTKRSCRCIDLVIMSAVRKRTQLLNEGTIPRPLDQLDKAVLALRGERIGAIFLGAFFTFARHAVALQ